MDEGNAATKREEAPLDTDTGQYEAPVDVDNVTFSSPFSALTVNVHLRPQRKRTRDGVTVIDEEVVICQFLNGHYATSDQRIIELLRSHPHNVGNLEDFEAGALRGFKTRFYEDNGRAAA